MQQRYAQMVPRLGGCAHIVPMNKSPELLTQPAIVVVPWVDPVVDAAGASLFSRYVELYWLPVLGPSALWILRRVVMGFETYPEGYELDCAATANDIGLSFSQSPNNSFTRSLQRCLYFGALQPHQGGLAVRCYLPAVSKRHLQRLSPALREVHEAWNPGNMSGDDTASSQGT
jgi:hypothetical protein